MDQLKETVVNLSSDFFEVAVDTLIENEVVKEFPIIGSLVKLAKIKDSISDKILCMKLEKFLTKFELQKEKHKIKLLDKIEKDDNRKKIGEQLILLIDKYGDFEKPEILAIIFASYLKNNITLDEFLRMGHAIYNIYIDDLKYLLEVESAIEQKKLDNYLGSGFSKISRQAIGIDEVSIIKLQISDLGKKFIEILQSEKEL